MNEKHTLKEFHRVCPYCGENIYGDDADLEEHKRLKCPKRPK